MKLTGKSKEVFRDWYTPYIRKQRPDYIKFTDEQILRKFYRKIDSEKYGVLVDFFDSVGIKIFIFYNSYEICDIDIKNYYNDVNMDTRTQAREQAITKAVEILNNRK